MDAIKLAKDALRDAAKYKGVLSNEMQRKVALAYLTEWIGYLDGESLHKAPSMILTAEAIINDHFASKD